MIYEQEKLQKCIFQYKWQMFKVRKYARNITIFDGKLYKTELTQLSIKLHFFVTSL